MILSMFIILTIIDIAASAIIFIGALNDKMRLYPSWHKVGLILASFGLLAQGVRNIQFIITGQSPADASLPFWALKDLGIAIIAFFYCYMAFKAYKSRGKTTRGRPRKKAAK